MKKLERLNLKNYNTLNNAEMKQILGGMGVTKPPLRKCKANASECDRGECDVAFSVQGTC